MTRRGVPAGWDGRQAQIQRSTFVGALNGRVVNAYPRPAPRSYATVPGPAEGDPGELVLWYTADGATGSIVDLMPATIGPTMVYPYWETHPKAVVSGDSPVAYEFDNTGPILTYYAQDGESPLGQAHGISVFMVIEMAADADIYTGTAMVDLILAGITGAGYGIYQVTVRNDTHRLIVTTLGGDASFKDSGGGFITNGACQLVEVRQAADSATTHVRIGGSDLVLDGAPGEVLHDFTLAVPQLGGAGIAGAPTKVWEIQVYSFEVTDSELADVRTGFAGRYGILT